MNIKQYKLKIKIICEYFINSHKANFLWILKTRQKPRFY